MHHAPAELEATASLYRIVADDGASDGLSYTEGAAIGAARTMVEIDGYDTAVVYDPTGRAIGEGRLEDGRWIYRTTQGRRAEA